MSDRLRICFLAPGTNIHTARWVTGIAGLGHEVLLVPQGTAPALPVEVFDPYRAMGPLARIPKVRGYLAQKLILSRIRRFEPDIVHLHWLEATSATLLLVRQLEPLIVSVWGRDLIWDHDNAEPYVRIRCKKAILTRARRVTATSRFLAERIRTLVPEVEEVDVVPFGVDCDLFRPSEMPPDRAIPVIGFLKHYTPKYGPDVLLHAAAALAQRGVRFQVEMYGTQDAGPYRQLARALGLENRVTISGPVEHTAVPDTMRRFDVYVMPSVFDSETFGVAALEASACGVPVVASRVGGVPETVMDGVSGELVPPADPAALADALEGILQDSARRRRFAEDGRKFVTRSYRWEDSLRQMEEVYSKMLTAKAARTRHVRS